jgi:hypothetical protein
MSVPPPSSEAAENGQDEPPAKTKPAAMVGAVLVLLGAALLAAIVLYRIYPDGVVTKDDPSFLDNIFANTSSSSGLASFCSP